MSTGLAGETTLSTPSISVAAKPAVSGSGSTITFSGGYADSATVESIAVYSGDVLIGTATLNEADQTWSLTVTLGAGLYESFTVVLIDILDGSATASFPYSLLLGVTAQFFVTEETDLLDGSVVSETFYRSDSSIYKIDNYEGGVLTSENYYNVIGAPFTSYELDYDAEGHLYSRIYYGYKNQEYSTAQYDYSYSPETTHYSLDDIKYYTGDGSLYEEDFYHSDGGHSAVFYGITGREYTSYEIDYDGSSTHISQKYFGYAGVFYDTLEQDYVWAPETGTYTWQATLYLRSDGAVLEKVAYGPDGSHVNTAFEITGRPFTSREIDYDGDNHYSSVKYFGFTDRFYASVQYDYSWSPTTSQELLLDALFFSADGSVLETEKVRYAADGGHVNQTSGITGKPFTSEEIDYDKDNHYTTVKYSGFTDRFYASVRYDYGWSPTTSQELLLGALFFSADGSVLESENVTYGSDGSHVNQTSGITGKAFTSEEIDYDKDNHYTTVKYSGFTDRFYESVQYDYSWSSTASRETLLDALYFSADGSLAEKVVYEPDGGRSSTFYGPGGGASQNLFQNAR